MLLGVVIATGSNLTGKRLVKYLVESEGNKNIMNYLIQLAKKPDVEGVSVSKVDCTASTTTCGEYNVQGYPTLLYFR